jgi:hypothetical protein
MAKKLLKGHACSGNIHCKICKKIVPTPHHCFVQVKPTPKKNKDLKFYIYSTEIPVLVAQTAWNFLKFPHERYFRRFEMDGILPISSTLNSDTDPIEFEIKGQGDEYLDLSQSYLQVVCKFTKGDGINLAGGGSTSTPLNNILHSLFSEIDVSVNEKVVTPGTDTYPYKAYLEKLLSYSPDTLKTDESLYVMGKRHGRTHGRTQIRSPTANC